MSQPQEETGSKTIRSSRVKVTQGSLDRPFDAKVVKVQGDLASLGETGSNNEKVSIGMAGPSSNVKEPLGSNEAGKKRKSIAVPEVTLANFKTSTPKKDGKEGQRHMGVKSAKKARKGILNTSSVFDHEDDVEVRQILAKQMKQAKDCKVGGPQRTSPATAVTPCRKLVACSYETYERKFSQFSLLSEAPGVEASGSADVPQAQKSSPAGEKFPTLCSL